ncbi:hypothetical protein BX070DRAFT_120163 [Coemansia spiralis]|nr:hypothetical protein BX070DRAFT_120163 [Coemansia spiralis]
MDYQPPSPSSSSPIPYSSITLFSSPPQPPPPPHCPSPLHRPSPLHCPRSRPRPRPPQRLQPPYFRRTMNFPSALYRVIQNPANSNWIRWEDNGASFRFHDWDQLINELRKLGFRASRRTSVDRNLHDYRFVSNHNGRHRIPDLNDDRIWFKFHHEYFTRDNPDFTRIIRTRQANPRR